MAKRLRVEIGECVLIDDQTQNVEGAKTAGMAAVLYQDVARLKKDLAGLL
jgi:HAD superfamily hydrolase (TIGR01509 family)